MSVFEGRAWIANQGLLDVSIEVDNGYISSVKKTNSNPDKEKVNGLILPAAMDMHVHFRDPGYPHKEDWKTGSESAACGGVTAVVDMPNTNPFTSNLSLFKEKEKHQMAQLCLVMVYSLQVEKFILKLQMLIFHLILLFAQCKMELQQRQLFLLQTLI